MPGAAPCELLAFSQVSLDPGEIVVRGRCEEALLQSSDASIDILSGHSLSLGAAAVSLRSESRFTPVSEEVGTRVAAATVELHMARSFSGRDVLLAVALGSRRRDEERRRFPDRRSGVERRRASVEVSSERRSNLERRQTVRRKEDRDDGATLLQKARSCMPRQKVRDRLAGDPN